MGKWITLVVIGLIIADVVSHPQGSQVGFGAVTYNVATAALVPTWLTYRP